MKTCCVLLLLLLAACGELVTPGTYPANRTLGIEGGSVSLDRITVTVPPDVLTGGLTLRLDEAGSGGLPGGALGPAYRLRPDNVPAALAATGLEVAWHVEMEELPEGVWFVDLAVARLEGDAWVPLDDPAWDPIAGEVLGRAAGGGTFTVVHAPPDVP